MRRPWIVPLIALLAAAPAAAAGTAAPAAAQPARAELVLDDGQRLAGVSVARKGDMYFLRLSDGTDVPVAADRVRQVRLTQDDAAPAAPAGAGVPAPEPPLPPRAPGGLTATEPVTLAGSPEAARAPELSEQLRVLQRSRSVFRRGPIDPGWTPADGWDTSLARTQFNPARWARSPIDPTWRPVPAYTTASDVTGFNPARWFTPPIDATWHPADGFRWLEPHPPPREPRGSD